MKKLTNFFKSNIVLVLICLLFLVTRIYRVDSIPESVYWDEASIGYNAYSILLTGKDEWGEFLPLHFRAFGEFKLPVYIYSVVISEFFFGLTNFAIRLPAIIFGLLSVIGIYFVTLRLTNNRTLSLLSSFTFSITPWFFIFSRTGYEATAGLAFFIWSLYFLILSFQNYKLLILSTMLFIVSMYSYNSFRILSPLILGPFLIYFLLKKKFVHVLIPIIFILLSILPIYKLYSKDSGLARFNTVGSNNYISNFLKNFSPTYLFLEGDINPRSQVPKHGQVYYLDSLFIILGVLYILKTKNLKLYFILMFLLLAPIPASITKENPHALRAILTSPILSVISAMGIYFVSKNNRLILVFISVLYLLFFGNYFYRFINEYNNISSSAWQLEYKEIFKNQKSGCISDEFAQPYIFALYYNKFDPNEFVTTKKLNPVSDWGFSTVKSFGNFEFKKECR